MAMLSPRRQPRPLMPQDKEIIKLAGISPAQYRWFLEQAARHSRTHPIEGPVMAIDFLTALAINFVIGLAFSAISYFLAPKPVAPGAPPRQRTRNVDGQSLVRGDQYTARNGFDSVQNVVELGSIVPLVYAHRQIIDGVAYGGIRVNADLLWSQMLSLGGNQLFRGIFLIGQGGIQEVDWAQTAIGDQLLTSFGIDRNDTDTARVSIYARLAGSGRLRGVEHYVAGRRAADDPGNMQRRTGATDVYQVPNHNYSVPSNTDSFAEWNSSTGRPSNQTTFGLYAPIGSCLSYRQNPTFRPQSVPSLTGTDLPEAQQYKVLCDVDGQVAVERRKHRASFHGRVTLSGTASTAGGDTVTLTLSPAGDGAHEFVYDPPYDGPSGREIEKEAASEISCLDVAQAISGRQRSYDDAIVIGEQYMIGDGLAVCISRSNNSFVADADNEPIGGGSAVTATFRFVTAASSVDSVAAWSQTSPNEVVEGPILTATGRTQIFKAAVANVVIGRKARVVELGFRSSLGIQISGLTNFSTCWDYEKIDFLHCDKFQFVDDPVNEPVYDNEFPFRNVRFQNGQLQLLEERYSFFRIRYRKASDSASSNYTTLSNLYGFRGRSQQAVYNYIRIAFSSYEDWDIQIRPVSGWKVRDSGDSLYVIDFKEPEISVVDSGVTLTFNGESIANTRASFRIPLFENPTALGIATTDGSYVDGWAKLAEMFIYDEITTSAQSGPEHEITYVNVFSRTSPPGSGEYEGPDYDDLAIFGMNLGAGPELRQLSQVSAYVTKGIGGWNLFPQVLRDVLTNSAYEASGTLSPEQIDDASFSAASTFCYDRRYFCDIGISEPINRREWGQEMATNHLLELVTRNGKLGLRQAFDFVNPEPITALFTAGNIVEDSLEVSGNDSNEIQPVKVSVKWRQERETNNILDRPLFPVVREVTVYEVGTPANARVVRIDLSEWCTSEKQAIDVGKYQSRIPKLRRRGYKFKTWPQAGAIVPGRCFKLGLENRIYDRPFNGTILADGTVSGWPDVADGIYTALVWVTATTTVAEQSITITNGKAVGLANAVFSISTSSTDTATCMATKVNLNEEAEVEVEAVEFPVDASGVSLYAQDFDNPAAWVIEGQVA